MDEKAKHNVFISWSGQMSKSVGLIMRKMIPLIVSDATAWMSSEDIAKGAAWAAEIEAKLSEASVGIIVLTRESITAPWVLFESGALSKALSSNCPRCTLLCDLEKPVSGPLGHFQATSIEKSDLKKLLIDIDAHISTRANAERISLLFDKTWPDFEKDLQEAMAGGSGKAAPREPSVSEMVKELVSGFRIMERRMDSLEQAIKTPPLRDRSESFARAISAAKQHRSKPSFYPGRVTVQISDEVKSFLASTLNIEEIFVVRKAIEHARDRIPSEVNAVHEFELEGWHFSYTINDGEDESYLITVMDVSPF